MSLASTVKCTVLPGFAFSRFSLGPCGSNQNDIDTPFIEVLIVPLPKAVTPATELEALTGIVIFGRGSTSGLPTEVESLVVVMLVPTVELTMESVVLLMVVLILVEIVLLIVEAVLPAVPVTEDIVLSTIPVGDEMVSDRVCAFTKLVTDIMT
jgi:hypothetical protein